jgi:hypothetical protein
MLIRYRSHRCAPASLFGPDNQTRRDTVMVKAASSLDALQESGERRASEGANVLCNRRGEDQKACVCPPGFMMSSVMSMTYARAGAAGLHVAG